MRGNAGKGGALEAGAKRTENADIVLLLDADLGRGREQGALLLAPIARGRRRHDDRDVPARLPRKAGFGLVMRLARWGITRYGGDVRCDRSPLGPARA